MPDYLSCGSCPVDFALNDIVSFIEHKRQRCIDSPTDADQLECFKCSKRFNTPWPLLFHIQMDHQILIVRNLENIQMPLSYGHQVHADIQSDDMDTGVQSEDFISKRREVFTQTQRRRKRESCCPPILLPTCCQKTEPQCYDEPCICPSSSNVICTSEACFINKNASNGNISDVKSSFCPCLVHVETKSKEVQTDPDYNDDVDLNFILNNNDNREPFTMNTNYPQSVLALSNSSSRYVNQFSLQLDKNPWNLFSHQSSTPITEAINPPGFLTNFENNSPTYPLLISDLHVQQQFINNSNNSSNLIIEPPSLNSSPSQHSMNILSNNHDNSGGFHIQQMCTTDTVMSVPGNYHDNSLHYNATGGCHQSNNSNIINIPITQSQLIQKDNTLLSRQALIPSNDNISLSLFSSNNEVTSDFSNSENIDIDKTENERKEFRFLCPTCGKRFRQKVHLRKHVMSQHARQKPHKCSQCGYTTVEKSHLTVHIRTHTGERPYTCRRCSYSSAQNCTLKSHYLRRHPGDQIECNLCGMLFITEQERNNHQRSCRIVNGGGSTGLNLNCDQQTDRNNILKTAP